MSYITTKLQPLKSYPTYQFYAKADSKTESIDDVFKICVLESFRWLRSRLNNFDSLPNDIRTESPDQFKDFSESELRSFNFNNGLSIDVIYIEKKGIWSFQLSESDIGANKGTDSERPPVQGRVFYTEIAFIKQENYVEVGIRTICSEPSDCTVDCEVFRPTLVKGLVGNDNIRLSHGGLFVDGKPLAVTTKNAFDRFCQLIEDDEQNFPILLIADSKTEIPEPKIAPLPTEPLLSVSGFGLSKNTSFSGELSISIDAVKITNKKNVSIINDQKKKEKKIPENNVIPDTRKTKLPVIDFEYLAEKLVGFAFVCFVDEKFFQRIEAKTHIPFTYGDIILLNRNTEVERYSYDEYKNNIDDLRSKLRYDIQRMPKRSVYTFGEVMFHSDAKLQEYHVKRHETSSLEEQCAIYRLENAELKKQLHEQSQHATDIHQTMNSLRTAQKKLETLNDEYETLQAAYYKLVSETQNKQEAYMRSAEHIQFYKEQLNAVTSYPKSLKDVCEWAEETFSGNLIISSRAKSEMRKYNGALYPDYLCDGLSFLNSYADFRNGKIDEEKLQLYAERNNWEVQGCGKEALKHRRDDYIVTINGNQYLLDLHIKHGVSPQDLVRIYFCYDSDSGKIIIGSMPEHLATVKQNT